MALKIKSTKPTKSAPVVEEQEAEAVEEVVTPTPAQTEEPVVAQTRIAVAQADIVPPVATSPAAAPKINEEGVVKMAKISIFVPIKPAPQIGNISLIRDYGIEELKQQVYTLPENVVDVLVDRKYGTRI